MFYDPSVEEFVDENGCDCSSCLIRYAALSHFEKEMDVRFGPQLCMYLLRYGYLGFKFVDLYGINSFQGKESDMVKVTKRLHSKYPETKGLTALEDRGEADYRLVDSDDKVYTFIPEAKIFEPTGMNLSQYILSRFQEVREYSSE